MGLSTMNFMVVILPKQVPTFRKLCAHADLSPALQVRPTWECAWGVRIAFVKTEAAIPPLPQSIRGSQARARIGSPEGRSAEGSPGCPRSGPARRWQGPGREWSRRWSGRRGQGRGAEGGRPPLPRVPAEPRGCAGRPNIIQHPASALAPGAGASRPLFGCLGPV